MSSSVTVSPSATAARSDSSLPAAAEPVRVIYVMGAGRSGSTALEAMLGDHEDTVAVGEIAAVFSSIWDERCHCSCGERGPDCPVWRKIFERWRERTGLDTFEAAGPLNARYESLRRCGLLQWQRQTRAATEPTPEDRLWLERTAAVYQAVADVTGRRVIIDSSKNPLRARALCLTPGLDVRLIHLTRDVRGVVWSRLKAYRRDPEHGFGKEHAPVPVWRSVGYWGLTNLISSAVRRTHPECLSMLLRYEDYTAEPIREFARISEVTGLDYGPIAERLVAGHPVRPQHTCAGNPVRMQGAIRLAPDYQWMTHLPESMKRRSWLLGGWLARCYGYEKHPAAPAVPATASPSTRAA